MDIYTIAWLGWIAIFFVIEIPALLNSRSMDTLSEHLWWWLGYLREPRTVVDAEKLMAREKTQHNWVWVRRMLALFFVAWLIPHFFAFGWV